MTTSTHFLNSRTGDQFVAEVESRPDGSLEIVSNAAHGYKSAHLDYARHYFSQFGRTPFELDVRLRWINLNGVEVACSTYKPIETP